MKVSFRKGHAVVINGFISKVSSSNRGPGPEERGHIPFGIANFRFQIANSS